MILIQCVSSKREKCLPAKELYDSTYFDAMKRYAEASDDDYRILSAKHGLVHPEAELDPYDAFGLSEKQAETIAATLADAGVNTVKIVAGKKYTDPLTPELEARGIDVVEVGRGMRIGNRVKHLKEKARELENHTL